MNYKLAKELKGAGFSQDIQKERILWYTANGNEVVLDKKMVGEIVLDARMSVQVSQNRDDAYAPTLEELIEACGDNFANLMLTPAKEWLCTTTIDFNDFGSITPPALEGRGSNPSEAVARLWLVLNNK